MPIGRIAVLAAAVVVACGACGGGGGAASDDVAEIPGVGVTRMDVPRPTGAASAPCDEDPLPPARAQPIVERVADLRAIGLFADRAGVADAVLADEIEADLEATWSQPTTDGTLTPIPIDDPFMDLFVAQQDADRVWWNDLEADVSDGNEVYVDTIDGWAAISAGTFAPSKVEETWDGETGPVTVTFDLAGAAQALHPAYLEDWIDPRILAPINELIGGTGRRFELVKAFDQTAFVMALNEAERHALESRGWCFE